MLTQHHNVWDAAVWAQSLTKVAIAMQVPSCHGPKVLRVNFDGTYSNKELVPQRDPVTKKAYLKGGRHESLTAAVGPTTTFCYSLSVLLGENLCGGAYVTSSHVFPCSAVGAPSPH